MLFFKPFFAFKVVKDDEDDSLLPSKGLLLMLMLLLTELLLPMCGLPPLALPFSFLPPEPIPVNSEFELIEITEGFLLLDTLEPSFMSFLFSFFLAFLFLITSLFRDNGLIVPCNLWNSPQALHNVFPFESLLHRGVFKVLQL